MKLNYKVLTCSQDSRYPQDLVLTLRFEGEAPDADEPICLVDSAPDLLKALEDCSKELRSMIDRHNVQNKEDGSYPYDHQTVVEADKAIAKARGQQ